MTHLIDRAIQDEININCVFDSKLCTEKITKETFGFTRDIGEEEFPECHQDDDTFTAAYKSASMISLLNN